MNFSTRSAGESWLNVMAERADEGRLATRRAARPAMLMSAMLSVVLNVAAGIIVVDFYYLKLMSAF